jgi:hypothetical protein
MNGDKSSFPRQKHCGGAVGVGTMNFIQEYLTALFGWHVMQRQCYVEKQDSIKNYDGFRSKNFEFGASSNNFNHVPLKTVKRRQSAETILFKPKSKPTEKIMSGSKVRRVA